MASRESKIVGFVCPDGTKITVKRTARINEEGDFAQGPFEEHTLACYNGERLIAQISIPEGTRTENLRRALMRNSGRIGQENYEQNKLLGYLHDCIRTADEHGAEVYHTEGNIPDFT